MKNILQICANLQSDLGSDLINTTGLVEINLVLSAAFTKATHRVLCTQCHLLARFGIVATLFSTSKSCTENTDSQNTKKTQMSPHCYRYCRKDVFILFCNIWFFKHKQSYNRKKEAWDEIGWKWTEN